MSSQPTNEDLEELLLSCRYGELDEVTEFVALFGKEHLFTVRDSNGNTVLHMTCGNGHAGQFMRNTKQLGGSFIA